MYCNNHLFPGTAPAGASSLMPVCPSTSEESVCRDWDTHRGSHCWAAGERSVIGVGQLCFSLCKYINTKYQDNIIRMIIYIIRILITIFLLIFIINFVSFSTFHTYWTVCYQTGATTTNFWKAEDSIRDFIVITNRTVKINNKYS